MLFRSRKQTACKKKKIATKRGWGQNTHHTPRSELLFLEYGQLNCPATAPGGGAATGTTVAQHRDRPKKKKKKKPTTAQSHPPGALLKGSRPGARARSNAATHTAATRSLTMRYPPPTGFPGFPPDTSGALWSTGCVKRVEAIPSRTNQGE